jgi:hypothetical protein
MKKIVLLLSILMLYGCVTLLKDSKPIITNQLKSNEIEENLTADVNKYEEIVLSHLKKLEKENDPEKYIKRIWETDTLHWRNFSCIHRIMDEIDIDIKSEIEDEYQSFVNKLHSKKKAIMPYQQYILESIDVYLYKELSWDEVSYKANFEQETTKNVLILDLEKLKLRKWVFKATIKVVPDIIKNSKDQTYVLNIRYLYKPFIYNKNYKEVGIDKFKLFFHHKKNENFVQMQRLEGSTGVIQNIDGFIIIFKKMLSNKSNILVKNELPLLELKYQANVLPIRQKYIEKIKPKKMNNKIKLLSSINDEELFCLMFEKNFNIFEKSKDISIKKITLDKYKNIEYLNLYLFHLNILNNANIKFNDSYKISRYLFDKVVRPGIRLLSDILSANKTSGIAFSIVSSEKSFVSENDPSWVKYQFYLPKKQILQYVNDDITGQELADASYILVDGERIELR